MDLRKLDKIDLSDADILTMKKIKYASQNGKDVLVKPKKDGSLAVYEVGNNRL